MRPGLSGTLHAHVVAAADLISARVQHDGAAIRDAGFLSRGIADRDVDLAFRAVRAGATSRGMIEAKGCRCGQALRDRAIGIPDEHTGKYRERGTQQKLHIGSPAGRAADYRRKIRSTQAREELLLAQKNMRPPIPATAHLPRIIRCAQR